MRSASAWKQAAPPTKPRSEEHTSELQSHSDLVCRLLLEKKKDPAADALLPVGGELRVEPLGRAALLSEFFLRLAYRDDLGVRQLELLYFFFFNDTATTEIYTLSLHDALPI